MAIARATFHCHVCGRPLAWKLESVGKTRVCACGEFVPVPPAPAAAANAVPLVDAAPQSLPIAPAPTAPVPPTFADEPAPPAEPEDVYVVRESKARAQRRIADLTAVNGDEADAASGTAVISGLLSDVRRRGDREVYAHGTIHREWVWPCVFIVVGAVADAYEIQRHLRVADAMSYIGRALALYVLVNAMGIAAGCLLVKALFRIGFGRFLTSWLKWIAIALASPGAWVGIFELALKFHIGGDYADSVGIFVGWAVEVSLFYVMAARFFDIEPLDIFWTVVCANGMKIALFVSVYLLRPHFTW